MNHLRKIGISFLVVATLTLVLARFLHIDSLLAQFICGDRYMVEPDPSLAAQGILTDRACGFDADMGAAAVMFFFILLGLSFLIASFFTNNK